MPGSHELTGAVPVSPEPSEAVSGCPEMARGSFECPALPGAVPGKPQGGMAVLESPLKALRFESPRDLG